MTRRPRRSRAATAAALTALTTTALLGLAAVPEPVSAALASTTTSTAAFTTGAFPDYPTTVTGGSPSVYHRFDETAGSTAADRTGRNPATYAGTAPTDHVLGVAGALRHSQSPGTAVQLKGTAGIYSTVAETAPGTFSTEVWFRSSGSGGPLAGFSAAQTGSSSGGQGRTTYLTADGRLALTTGGNTIASSGGFSDGAWHLATATFSPTGGMHLYADGVLVAQNTAATSAATYTGYWRWGGGYDLGVTSFPQGAVYFTGLLDEVSVYPTELTAHDVALHYGANY